MEEVHCPSEKPWISDVVEIRSFLNSWDSLFDVSEFTFDKWKYMISNKSNSNSVDENSKLDDIYGAQALDFEGETKLLYQKEMTFPTDLDLMTPKLQKEELEKRKNPQYNSTVNNSFRYSNYPSTTWCRSANTVKSVEDPEAVLSLQLFRPVSHTVRTIQKRSPLTFIVDQHMLILGSQKLTEIRDRINCISDIAVPGDFSSCPDYPRVDRAKDLYKSGFFYINGTFYNDMRNPSSRDYSTVILNWAKETGRGIGPFKTKLMEETKVIDLELRLGYPYLYMHQGNCEHLMVFTNLRLLDSADSHNLNDYPMFQTVFAKRAMNCMNCDKHVARWLTYKNARLNYDPFFFCESCFRLFNYTVMGEKIGEFEAHPYFDRTAVV